MITFNRTSVIIILSLLILVGLGAFGFMSLQSRSAEEDVFDAKKTLARVNPDDEINDYLEIEGLIGETMKKYGTRAGFQLIDEGERQEIISNDDCHSFLHYVGHAAYNETPTDYEALVGIVEGTNCIGGYLHGIEAEIVLASPNVVQDVQNFCTFQKNKGVNPGPCFHGVGHAAAELYNYDVQKGLALCDSLAGGPEDDLSNCYRGIFSEVGNVAIGFDGHTGLQVEKIAIDGLDPSKPFDYCFTFEKRHQSSCQSQLLKLIFDSVDREKWLDICLDPSFSQHSKEICTNIISGVYMRSKLSFEDSAVLPPIINTFPEDLQKISMLGALETFMGYLSDGAVKDWKPFCDGFTKPEVSAYCAELFEDTIKNGTAPWMEYDIR
jgi:hypothetical protein